MLGFFCLAFSSLIFLKSTWFKMVSMALSSLLLAASRGWLLDMERLWVSSEGVEWKLDGVFS